MCVFSKPELCWFHLPYLFGWQAFCFLLYSSRISAEEEILKDERSSKSFAFPSALFWQSDVAFSQCVIWWQRGAREKGTNCIHSITGCKTHLQNIFFKLQTDFEEISGSQIDFTNIFLWKKSIDFFIRVLGRWHPEVVPWRGDPGCWQRILVSQPMDSASWPPLLVG